MQPGSRIVCRVSCEVSHGRARSKGSVLDLSEGGLGLATRLCLAEGDEISIALYPHRGDDAIVVHGIVWSSKTRTTARGEPAPPLLGIMLSKSPKSYHDLLRRLASEGAGGARIAQAAYRRPTATNAATAARLAEKADLASMSIVTEEAADTTLPRPKYPLPPPKTADPETLPLFAIRVKQRSGTRTRRLKLRAPSVHDAERQIREDLDGDWEILEINSIALAVGGS